MQPSGPLHSSKDAGKVPNSKKAKPRAPRGWRDRYFFPGRSLPTYTGSYSVGTMEIEVPVANPRTFSDIKRDGRHLLRLETVLMTVYYPTNAAEYNLRQRTSKLSRELWLGRPRLRIAEGYGKFAGLGKAAVPFFLPVLYTKLPAYRNAPIASQWAPAVNTRQGGKNVKTEAGERPEGASKEPVFPLMLFSHGLGGTRTMYSSVCGEFASYGFVVCAVEHRDGSGPRTYVNHTSSGEASVHDREQRGAATRDADAEGKGYDSIDYVFSKLNPSDTSPRNTQYVDHELRNAQMHLRLAELEEAYLVMCDIAAGKGQHVADKNLRRKGFKASSSHGLEGVDWPQWKDRIHLDHVTASGHSFGAATVTELLRHNDRFAHISQGIIYDIWGAATQAPDKESSERRIHVPLLAINSEAFTYWPSNFDLVQSLIEETQDEPYSSPAWLMTLRGTVHISQSDITLLYPHLCSIVLKMAANPRRALDLNINASLEFLAQVMPTHLAQVVRAHPKEGILESDVSPLERIPSVAKLKPREKWTAVRLRIKHEWLFRLSPDLFRKALRREQERKGKSPETGDEVWVHVKPTAESIERHRRKMSQLPQDATMGRRSAKHMVGDIPSGDNDGPWPEKEGSPA